MSKKLCFLISVIIVVALAAPVSADELLASYEDSEYPDLSVTATADPGLTVARVEGGVGGVPPATDGDYVLKWVWINETDLKIQVRHDWAVRRLDLAPYNLITADVWFDEPNAQCPTIGIWDDIFGWAGALEVPIGLNQWHTVEMDIGGTDANNIDHIFAFLFEDLAGDSGVLYTDNMWLVYRTQLKAWRPIPFDKAVSMDPNVDLSWEAGIDVNSHDVYFGTDEAAVTDANVSNPMGVYKGNKALGNTSYDPGTLERLKTYYWRIDEVNEPNVWKGDIWSFKTAPSEYIEIPLTSYEESETHYEVWASPAVAGDDLTLVLGDKLAGGSTWDPCGPLPPVSVPTASDGSNVLGLVWDNEQDLEVEHGINFLGGFTYDLYGIEEMVFDIYYDHNDSEGGFNPLPHSMGVFDWDYTPSFNGSSNLPTTRGEWHTIVIDVSHLNNTGMDHILDFMFQAHGKDFDPNGADPDNWGALVFMDNLRLRFAGTPYATLPSPSHTATDVDRNADLSWREGFYADSHDVYLGTSFAEVFDANTSSAGIFKGNQPLVDVNYEPGILDPDRTYYWRIDEVNDTNVWKGNIWSFTTVGYSVVDDFDELYTTDASLRAVWKDYFTQDPPKTSAEVYVESTIVHNDSQSMMYWYRNNLPPFYSESRADIADLPNSIGSDWTAGNTEALALWFYGQSGNDANEGLYVALEDGTGKVAVKEYDGDMNDLKKEEWQQWNIRLQDFVDDNNVDLTNVSRITIGFSHGAGVGGSGTVYFDEIMLYPPRCVPALSLPEGDFTGDCLVDNDDLEILAHDWLIGDYNVVAVAQNDANLVAWYKFENNFNDSSGNGNTGTGHGGISFVAGANGLAIDLDGLGDYMSIPDSNTPGGVFDINDTITVSAWIKVTTFDKWYQTIIAKGDDSWRLARYQDKNWLEFAASGVSGGADPPFGNVIGRTSVNDNQWHHVAGLYDGSKVYLYIDGILDNTEGASGAINNSSYNVYIGENEQELGREWDGFIDDVRIYDYGLSHAEIVNLVGESEVYQPVLSPANLYDEESKFSKKINFRDYAVMADRWLKELLFPFE